MSWAAYVTQLETGKGRCSYAAIFGKNPFSVWAESTDKSQLPVSAEEITPVIRAIGAQDQSLMGTGIVVGRKKFTCLRMEPELLICQGKAENKDDSLVIALSGQAVVLAFNHESEIKTSQVREHAESMKDYLKSVGY
ncbi:hypothetical protein Btru_055362 [Bulinus truncatus]|nr:hypothetical protein Btru_055362 [Bulinus truncatus]